VLNPTSKRAYIHIPGQVSFLYLNITLIN